MKPMLAPSLLSADFAHLADAVTMVAESGADIIHLDVMDGHYVPNITFGPVLVKAVRKTTMLPLDVHLMIQTPDEYIDAFAQAGADGLSVHLETCNHLDRTIQVIKSHKIKAGVALNPSTPICLLDEILHELDFILVMSVNPGFGGQKFIPSTLAKISKLKSMITARSLQILISVDGGVGHDNAAELILAGTDILIAGNSVFGAADPRASVRTFKDIIMKSGRI